MNARGLYIIALALRGMDSYQIALEAGYNKRDVNAAIEEAQSLSGGDVEAWYRNQTGGVAL